MPRGMSYRLRLPLSMVATALFTALVLGLVITWHTYRNVQQELIDNGGRLAHALASAVRPALLHDNVWLAYSILRGPRSAARSLDATFIVLDEEGRIFASSKPAEYPVALPLEEVDEPLSRILGAHEPIPAGSEVVDMERLPNRFLLAAPISSDGVPVGSLLVIYPRTVLWSRFTGIVRQGAVSMLLVLAIIIPVGWFWGHRMVAPLTRLADCMARLREKDFEPVECDVEEGDNEIGRLNARFHELLVGLGEKRALERQMISSERLAAVGRLASGVAHEINNPLGGMLLAVDTLRERGVSDAYTERTLALLERGLTQIQDTVSALLVEARREPHALAAQDIEDTRTLVATQVEQRGVRLEWDNRVRETLPLPSTLVRQVVINILLNAVQFAPQGGRVKAGFRAGPKLLSVTICNEGEAMEKEVLDHLFEPYYSSRQGGSGLGLWVSYQIVKQLGGEISVSSRDETCFRVSIPFPDPEEQSRAG